MAELIELKLKDIEIKLPESSEAVVQARKLLDKLVGLRGERKLPALAVENSEPLSIVDKYMNNNSTVDKYGV